MSYRNSRLSRMRVPALVALLLFAVCAAFWAADVFSAGPGRTGQTTSSHEPAPEARATAVPATDKESKPDAIEVIVGPEETLSGISVRRLGTFNDEVLRQIIQLNPGLENPDRITSGEKILLPKLHSLAEPDARKRQ